MKDPPCSFHADGSVKSETTNPIETTSPSDALEDDESVQPLVEKLRNSTSNKKIPLKIIHGYDSLHQSLNSGETGRLKGANADDELSLDLDPETAHKTFHDLKKNEPSSEPSVELDDEMSDPTQHEINKLHKSVSKLIKAAKANGFADDDEKSVEETAKVGNDRESKAVGDGVKNPKESVDNALVNILSKFKNLGKVKIIRLKSAGRITNNDIISALKGYSHRQEPRINGLSNDEMNAVSPFLSEDGLTNSMDALGTISKGEDFESQLLSQIPAEEAQKILADFSKPKPPPRIENSDGIKVAGDAGGNLQVMEQNPFSNAIYGSHTANDGFPIAANPSRIFLLLPLALLNLTILPSFKSKIAKLGLISLSLLLAFRSLLFPFRGLV